MDKIKLNIVLMNLIPSLDSWFPEGWYLTGSAYLVNNGYLDRDVHDIDIITEANYYNKPKNYLPSYCDNPTSNKWYDAEGNLIKCFSTSYKLNNEVIPIDIIYNPAFNKDNLLDSVIKYKLARIKDTKFPDQVAKNTEDINYLYKNPECKEIIDKYSNKANL